MRILYFAWLRQRIGTGSEEVSPPAEVTNIAELVNWLRTRGEGYIAAFADMDAVRMAVNQEHVQADYPVAAGDEIAFFPPVTGG